MARAGMAPAVTKAAASKEAMGRMDSRTGNLRRMGRGHVRPAGSFISSLERAEIESDLPPVWVAPETFYAARVAQAHRGRWSVRAIAKGRMSGPAGGVGARVDKETPGLGPGVSCRGRGWRACYRRRTMAPTRPSPASIIA